MAHEHDEHCNHEHNEQEQQQELLFKFSMFERQINELQQQIGAVENGIVELSSLNLGLDELKGNTGKEIFAPMGKGIFVKAKLLSEELNVDIGSGNIIQKSIPDTKALIEEQIKKLTMIKQELEHNLEELGEQINGMVGENPHDECSCGHENCNCSHEEDECECGKGK